GAEIESTVDVVLGDVVLVLPDDFHLPEMGYVVIDLTPLGSGPGSLDSEDLVIARPQMPSSSRAPRTWLGPRSSVGQVAVGEYDARVSAQSYFPGEDGLPNHGRYEILFGPTTVPLTVRANTTSELVVKP